MRWAMSQQPACERTDVASQDWLLDCVVPCSCLPVCLAATSSQPRQAEMRKQDIILHSWIPGIKVISMQICCPSVTLYVVLPVQADIPRLPEVLSQVDDATHGKMMVRRTDCSRAPIRMHVMGHGMVPQEQGFWVPTSELLGHGAAHGMHHLDHLHHLAVFCRRHALKSRWPGATTF